MELSPMDYKKIAQFYDIPKPNNKSYKEIAPAILKGVDYVVNLHHEKICNKPSLIIKLSNNGLVKVIRE